MRRYPLTRQPAIPAARLSAASSGNTACRRMHGGPSSKKWLVGGHGPSLRRGSKPLPASRTSIRALFVVPRPACLVAGLVMALMLLFLPAAMASAAAGGEDPRALVKVTTERLLSIMQEQREQLERDPEQIYGLVNEIVIPHFDFTRMSRWVLGKYWRQATPEQRRRFEKEFRTLLVKSYATSILEFVDDEFRYPPLRMKPGAKRVTVRTDVIRGGAAPVKIEYRLFKTKDGWKAYDVLVEGVSLVTNYRSSFAEEIRQGGLDKLIARLEKHNSKVTAN